jgi:hypothetical protein
MKLLLITGAGASRNLSADPDKPMPLMADWAETLRSSLGPDLASMTSLTDAATGVQFEETLGGLFRWHDQIGQAKRFAGMARASDRDPTFETYFVMGLGHARKHFQAVLKNLHESLFREFGPDRIDAERAKTAYEEAFDLVAGSPAEPLEIVCATTNYDRSLEAGLEAMGRTVRSGFKPHSIWTPTLDPAGLGTFQPTSVSLLYLHGAVGWYRRGNRITSQAADAPYNSSLGDPAVLYPGPDKDMGRFETVELWREFEAAVGDATHILVVGHALNDRHLVAALKEAGGRVAVTVYPLDDDGVFMDPRKVTELEQTALVLQRLPEAHIIGWDFGPNFSVELSCVEAWRDGAKPWRTTASRERPLADAK